MQASDPSSCHVALGDHFGTKDQNLQKNQRDDRSAVGILANTIDTNLDMNLTTLFNKFAASGCVNKVSKS